MRSEITTAFRPVSTQGGQARVKQFEVDVEDAIALPSDRVIEWLQKQSRTRKEIHGFFTAAAEAGTNGDRDELDRDTPSME